MDFFGRPTGAYDLDSRLGLGKREIPLTHCLSERGSRGLDPVFGHTVTALTSLAFVDRNIQNQIKIRLQSTGGEVDRFSHTVQGQSTPVPLVGQRRQREAIGQYRVTPVERRADDIAHERRACPENQEQLGLVGHVEVTAAQHNLPDRLTYRRTTGLPR